MILNGTSILLSPSYDNLTPKVREGFFEEMATEWIHKPTGLPMKGIWARTPFTMAFINPTLMEGFDSLSGLDIVFFTLSNFCM